eukprot:6870563-Pyramimonas_sp.AAC.1
MFARCALRGTVMPHAPLRARIVGCFAPLPAEKQTSYNMRMGRKSPDEIIPHQTPFKSPMYISTMNFEFLPR